MTDAPPRRRSDTGVFPVQVRAEPPVSALEAAIRTPAFIVYASGAFLTLAIVALASFARSIPPSVIAMLGAMTEMVKVAGVNYLALWNAPRVKWTLQQRIWNQILELEQEQLDDDQAKRVVILGERYKELLKGHAGG